MKTAAIIAAKFGIDPIIVLKSSFKDWAIRSACYQYIAAKEEAAARKVQASASAPRSARKF